ncbi:MAG: hypothetical protein GY926_26410 [bacterium]|nr:hypothetical protein [bacterium]
MKTISAMRSVLVLVAVLAMSAAASAAVATSPDLSAAQEESVPADAIQPLDDFTGNLLPLGDEKLPMLDMARPDGPAAKGYAEKHGVSLERASELIDWQATVRDELRSIATAAGDRYVKARIIHPDENKDDPGEPAIEVFIFEPTKEETAAIARLGADVSLEPAFADLKTIHETVDSVRVTARAEFSDEFVEVSVDPGTGDITIEASPPGHSDADCVPMSTQTGGQLDGGRTFRVKDENINCGQKVCTLGFSAYLAGKQGALTAAHCVNNTKGINYGSSTGNDGMIYSGDAEWWIEAQCQNWCNGKASGGFSWASLRPWWVDSYPDDDLGFVRERYGSTQPSGRVYVSNVGFYNIIGFYDDSSGELEGEVVCHSAGRGTQGIGQGEHCGEVEAHYSYAPHGWFGTSTNRWTRVDPYENGDAGGASGGPWYIHIPNSNNVVGLGIHTTSNWNDTKRYYERIDPAVATMRGAQGSGTSAYMFCAYGVSVQYCSATY